MFAVLVMCTTECYFILVRTFYSFSSKFGSVTATFSNSSLEGKVSPTVLSLVSVTTPWSSLLGSISSISTISMISGTVSCTGTAYVDEGGGGDVDVVVVVVVVVAVVVGSGVVVDDVLKTGTM